MRVDTGIVAIDAEGIVVEDGAQDAGRVDGVALAGGQLDGARVGEGEPLTRALPERNLLSIGQLGVFVMERVGLEEHIRGGTELGQHDHVLKVFRSESLHTADVEQGGHSGQTRDRESHVIGGEPDEVRVEDGVARCKALAVLLVKAIQKIDSSGVARAGIGAAAVHVIEGLAHHVVDGPHDEVVEGNGHALLNLVEEHGQESVELSGGGEGLIQRLLLHGPLDLERGHLVEELDINVRLVEHVRIVGRAVSEVPTFILGGHGEAGTDLLQNGAVAPVVHEDGGSAAGVGAVDEDHLANVVDQRPDEAVKGVGVEDGVTGIHDALKILGDEVIFAEGLDERVIDDLVNLFYFHLLFSFRCSRLKSGGDEIDHGGAIVVVDGDAQDVTGDDNVITLFPRDNGAGRAGSAGHVTVNRIARLAGGDGSFGAIVEAVDGLLFGLVQVETSAVHENVAGSCHVDVPPSC